MSASPFSNLVTVWRKELRDFLRDRRTLIFTLLVGPLIYPLLMLGVGKLTQMRTETQLEKPLDIRVVGQQRAPNLVAWLAGQGIRAKPASGSEA